MTECYIEKVQGYQDLEMVLFEVFWKEMNFRILSMKNLEISVKMNFYLFHKFPHQDWKLFHPVEIVMWKN